MMVEKESAIRGNYQTEIVADQVELFIAVYLGELQSCFRINYDALIRSGIYSRFELLTVVTQRL